MHYSFSDGLLSSSTYLVKEDESKRIFVNTYKELYYFNEAQGRFIDFILFYYNKNNREKQLEKRVSELKLISFYSQLNPHFLFNCLTSISGLIKTKEYNKSEIV